LAAAAGTIGQSTRRRRAVVHGLASHGDAMITVSHYADAPPIARTTTLQLLQVRLQPSIATPRIHVPMARVTRFEHDAILYQLMHRAYSGGTESWRYDLWEGLGDRRDEFEGYYARLCESCNVPIPNMPTTPGGDPPHGDAWWQRHQQHAA
jgi:hypothetical protein